MELYFQVPIIVLGQSGIYSLSLLLRVWLIMTGPLQQQLTVNCQLCVLDIETLFGYNLVYPTSQTSYFFFF
jgi:hypothetical protein